MSRAMRRLSARDEEPEREDTAARAPDAGVADLLRLQRTAGNHAVARLLARNQAGAPPVKDRKPIDDLAKATNVKSADRIRAYARIAGTGAVNMDPEVVTESGPVKDGLNLVPLKQASDVPAKTDFVDAEGRAHGGAPPETATGVAILVNVNASKFEDEDYMVAAIRHEMVHARLMRLTLKHLADWKQKPEGLSFMQYVDKKVSGTDGALVKDRFFGGHMDEVVAYAEGFLSAFFIAPITAPGKGTPSWIAHFEGFTKEFRKADDNAVQIPKDTRRIPPENLAMRQAANAVLPESAKQVKEYCDKAPLAQRENLAAWMVHLDEAGGLYRPALDMVHRAATGGKPLPKRKPK
jgi:hypothetical protein